MAGLVAGASCSSGSSEETAPVPPPPSVCPDGVCTGEETPETCPDDCAPVSSCGDGSCDQAGGECDSCAEDCPASACEPCGNGVCVASIETCATCAADCGDCLACGSDPAPAQVNLLGVANCDFFDEAHCLLPFPSNYFLRFDPTTDTKRRLNISLTSAPKNFAGVPLRPDDFNRVDGYSPVATLMTRVLGRTNDPVDLEKSGAPTLYNMARSLELDSPVVVIDAETGERVPVWTEIDLTAPNPSSQLFFVRPVTPYKQGRRYIVALRNLVDTQGAPISAPPGFRIFRDCVKTGEPAIEARRGPMEDVFSRLGRAGVKRSELYLAWDFTVASTRGITERLLHMRDQSFNALGQQPIEREVVQTNAPADDPHVLRTVSGTFLVPSYLSLPGPGGRMSYDANGLPVQQANPFSANFTCVIPKSVVRQDGTFAPSRIALYGHQSLGNSKDVFSTHVKQLANDLNITFCGTEWIGMAEDDIATFGIAIADMSNFSTVTDRLHQAHLNTLYLGRLMLADNGFVQEPAFRSATTNESLIDPSSLYFYSEAQGGALGVATSAIAKDWRDVFVNVDGIGYSLVLARSKDAQQYLSIVRQLYTNPVELTIAFELAQMLWDSTEASGYADHLTKGSLPGSVPKRVLISESFGDHILPNLATEMLARTIGARVRTPALPEGRSPDRSPFFRIEPIESFPYNGSALFVWDTDGAVAPPEGNLPPTEGVDPHFMPRQTPKFRALVGEFFKQGGISDVCGEGAPCKTELN